jgi:hypothetical protein
VRGYPIGFISSPVISAPTEQNPGPPPLHISLVSAEPTGGVSVSTIPARRELRPDLSTCLQTLDRWMLGDRHHELLMIRASGCKYSSRDDFSVRGEGVCTLCGYSDT